MLKKKTKDELEELMEELFLFVDRAIATLNRRYIALFNRLKNVVSEKEVISDVTEVYEEVDAVTRRYLLMIAKKVAEELYAFYEIEDDIDWITELWLLTLLEAYDPITKYVYIHEVDRKRARLIEAMIASDDKAKEVNSGLKTWSKQAKQYADNVLEKTIEDVYEQNEIIEVIWETEKDTRVCASCVELEGNIYPIDNIPSKPHYGCRCWVRPV